MLALFSIKGLLLLFSGKMMRYNLEVSVFLDIIVETRKIRSHDWRAASAVIKQQEKSHRINLKLFWKGSNIEFHVD